MLARWHVGVPKLKDSGAGGRQRTARRDDLTLKSTQNGTPLKFEKCFGSPGTIISVTNKLVLVVASVADANFCELTLTNY